MFIKENTISLIVKPAIIELIWRRRKRARKLTAEMPWLTQANHERKTNCGKKKLEFAECSNDGLEALNLLSLLAHFHSTPCQCFIKFHSFHSFTQSTHSLTRSVHPCSLRARVIKNRLLIRNHFQFFFFSFFTFYFFIFPWKTISPSLNVSWFVSEAKCASIHIERIKADSSFNWGTCKKLHHPTPSHPSFILRGVKISKRMERLRAVRMFGLTCKTSALNS